MTEQLISFNDTSVGYDGVAVLQHINFSIESGEFIALLGANGSGKSTLVRTMLGLAQPLEGSISMFGVDASHFNDRWRIGYVPQRTSIVGAVPATVCEVVQSGRLARLGIRRRLQRSDHEAVRVAIEAVGLGDHTNRLVSELSGGQQRRVTIARALAAEPDLLVLDEPTAGVDAENQDRLSATLGDLKSQGTTILLIAHEVGPIANLISRVIVVGSGAVTFDGPTNEHLQTETANRHDHVHHHLHDHDDAHAHGDPPPRPGTGLIGW